MSVAAAYDGNEPTPSSAAPLSEFLLNLSRYTVWPSDAGRSKLLFCVVDGGSLSNAELNLPAGTTSNGRAVALVVINHPKEAFNCQILWISADARPAPRDWLTGIRGLPILTVSNYADFTADGGIVGAYRRANGWRFEINTDGLFRSQLKVAAAALRLSTRFQSAQGVGE